MKVKVRLDNSYDYVVDGKELPIMLILSKKDKANIAAMGKSATKFCVFPEGLSNKEVEFFMKMPRSK